MNLSTLRTSVLALLAGLVSNWTLGQQQEPINNEIRYHNLLVGLFSNANNDNVTMDDPVFQFPAPVGCLGYQNGFDLPQEWLVSPTDLFNGIGPRNGNNQFTFVGYEDDVAPLCEYNSGDVFYEAWDVVVPNALNDQRPMEWGTQDMLQQTPIWSFTLAGVYSYVHGGSSVDPLVFDDMSPGEARHDLNNNGTWLYGQGFGAFPDLGYSDGEVWYQFNTTGNSAVTISTSEITFDTQVTLYESSGGSLTQIGYDDDGGGNYASLLTKNLCTGTYLVKVGGFQDETGFYRLNMTTAPWSPGFTVACNNITASLSQNEVFDVSNLVGVTFECGGAVTGVSPPFVTLGPQNAGPNTINVVVAGTTGTTATCTSIITIISTVGIEEMDLDQMRLYPNPTDGLLNVDLSEADLGPDAVIIVLDALGRSVATERAYRSLHQLDLSYLPGGMYTVHVRSGEQSTMRRITLL